MGRTVKYLHGPLAGKVVDESDKDDAYVDHLIATGFAEAAPDLGQVPEQEAGQILFASAEAEQLAAEAWLAPEDFAGVERSGKTGYTKADVEAIIESKADDPDE